ncbi:DUF2628 domain-containing protein [Bacillus sp. 1P06AnD]|uniref:DUF2628 domain-containing protein n=1 Tax=Bacillus sp. 1P06AnD TaxID=3132208 RepID=UPI0039A324FC
MKARLSNEAGVTKNVKIGFSWTTFFFGFFPALFRGDLKWAAIMFITAAVVGTFTIGFGAWIPGIIFSFVYNKINIKELLEKGYRPADERTREELQSRGIISASVSKISA